MKNQFLTVLFSLCFSVYAFSQSIAYDWVEFTKSDSIHSAHSWNLKADNSGNAYMILNYTSYDSLEFCDYSFPPISQYLDYSFKYFDDTTNLVKISPQGELLWEAPVFGAFAELIGTSNQDDVYIIYQPSPYITWFVFGQDTVYNYNYLPIFPPNPCSNMHVIVKYNQNGDIEWGKVFASEYGLGMSFEWIYTEGEELFVRLEYSGNLYHNGSMFYPSGEGDVLLKIASNGNIMWSKILQSGIGASGSIYIRSVDDKNLYCQISTNSSNISYDGNQLFTTNFTYNTSWYAIIDSLGSIISLDSLHPNFHKLSRKLDSTFYVYEYFNSPYLVYGQDTLFNPCNDYALAIAKLDYQFNPIWTRAIGIDSTYPLLSDIFVSSDRYTVVTFTQWSDLVLDNDTFHHENSPIICVINDSGNIVDIKSLAPNCELNQPWSGVDLTDNHELYIRGFRDGTYPDFYFNGTQIIESIPLFTFEICLFKLHLNFPKYTKQRIGFPQGWSLFSTYIEPDSLDISYVLAPVADSLELVKDENGLVFWPGWGINLIGDIVEGKAYQAYANNPCAVQVTGYEILPELTTLQIPQGWSMLGYLRQSPGNIDAMLTTIATQIILVKDETGDVYWPAFGINYIGDMMPGEGYLIKSFSNTTLTYPAN